MKNLTNGEYGEDVWERKIKDQDEAGVIFGSVCSLKDVESETKDFMTKIDKKVIPFLKKGSAVLDLGVGPMARFSIEFAKMGYNVTGVDISSTTLSLAEKSAQKAGVKINLLKKDITNLNIPNKKFDLIFCRATFYHVPPHLTGISLIYNISDMLIFPSICEGFGLPLLESISCGTPCVTSNFTPMTEVVGNAGVLVDPYNSKSIYGGITKCLENRDMLSKESLKRSKFFSLDKNFRETHIVYKSLLKK
ncbi:MAG: glycosyltransferase [Nanoarchaeota archaeon]|nr:glycosyltransferase [Nanoarchaeota archaeon]